MEEGATSQQPLEGKQGEGIDSPSRASREDQPNGHLDFSLEKLISDTWHLEL